MRNISLLPNIITAFGLACGLFVIFKMSMTPIGGVSVDVLVGIAGILILSAFADLLDGAIARVMKAESEFGGLFDSLADAISFGVAPAVVVLKTLSVEPGTSYSFLITFAAMVFTVCGVLRLIRFNINKNTIQHDDELLAAAKKNFTGLPIPAACGACISANLYLAKWSSLEPEIFTKEATIWVMVFVLTFLGYMMISRFRFPSLKSLHIKVASFKIVFLSILLTLLLFFGILHDFPLTFFAVSWLYLVVSLILYLARLIAGKRAKTLEDFEPAPEEEDVV
ncbi:CDP-alcohol phosphatidyltransferase family protein [Estrella lausannensis]|uniref:Putative CDP-diacylglycerol--serine O-phosphatidyltransferase PssA n=1 Tax=Estrella lausannensis TaxID=483423 RepID=A0A0H5DNG1_9BACT|nr:CDP-alcohol phosphatidyltransferase family protein [Estrella lausannensis]CRX37737.1 putative CDP-diacylglycerol--serine O-phosphatidyltransferase PssA [Estrella lausannensis]